MPNGRQPAAPYPRWRGWLDATCLALIVVVYRGLREEIEGLLASGLIEQGFVGLGLERVTEGFRAEILQHLGVAGAGLLVLGPATRMARHLPRGLLRRASAALAWAAGVALAVPLSLELAVVLRPVALGRPPWHVVLIVIDTLRADHLGIYGYDRGTSPRLDAFARDAFVFERAISNSSWTRPAVASLLTSQTPFEHGIHRESRKHTLAEGIPTLQRVLRDRGFRTAAFLTNAHYKAGLDRDFDELWHGRAPAGEVYDEVLARLDELGEERLFLLVHNIDPHDSFVHREGFSTRPASSTLRHTSRLLSARRRGFLFEDPVITPLGADELGELRDNYDGEIRYVDHHIGRFLDALAQRGLAEETVVVITADHGEEFFDHGSWWHGGTLYRELLHVPLMIRVPGMGAGRLDEWVAGIDVLPTVAELADARAPPSARGRSLVPLLRGEPLAPRAILSATGMRRRGVLASVVVDGHKLIRSPEGETIGVFDLVRDPAERVNLKDDVELERRLVAALSRSRAIAPAERGRPMELDASEREALRALGYLVEPEVGAGP